MTKKMEIKPKKMELVKKIRLIDLVTDTSDATNRLLEWLLDFLVDFLMANKTKFIELLREAAKKTSTPLDDLAVDALERILGAGGSASDIILFYTQIKDANNDSWEWLLDFLVDLLLTYKVEFIEMLREAAKNSDTPIDDWLVEIFAKLLGVE